MAWLRFGLCLRAQQGSVMPGHLITLPQGKPSIHMDSLVCMRPCKHSLMSSGASCVSVSSTTVPEGVPGSSNPTIEHLALLSGPAPSWIGVFKTGGPLILSFIWSLHTRAHRAIWSAVASQERWWWDRQSAKLCSHKWIKTGTISVLELQGSLTIFCPAPWIKQVPSICLKSKSSSRYPPNLRSILPANSRSDPSAGPCHLWIMWSSVQLTVNYPRISSVDARSLVCKGPELFRVGLYTPREAHRILGGK